MKKCWVVIGSTGEYSDRTEWVSKVFSDEAAAKAYCVELNEWALACGAHKSCDIRFSDYDRFEVTAEDLKARDPGFGRDGYYRIDYTGVDWTLVEAEYE